MKLKFLEKPEFVFFTGIGRLLFYLIGAGALFFAGAVIVFVLRGRDNEKLVMPDLSGKYYVDVHNDLAQSQLRVTIVKKHYTDRTPGVILHQSIPAGAAVRPREKLYVVVNQPDPIVKMPNLVATPLATAKAALGRIPYDDDVYALEIGAVSYVPAADVPTGTILAQFPPGGDNVSIRERVYLLVAGEPQALPKSEKELTGQNVSVLSEFFHRQNQDYRITELKPPPERELAGTVYKVEKDAKGRMALGVYYKKPRNRYESGFEAVDVDLDEKGECRAEQFAVGNDASEGGRMFFKTAAHEDDEGVKLVFYRTGTSDLVVSCGGHLVYEKRFKPEI